MNFVQKLAEALKGVVKPQPEGISGWATSFADPADVARFRACKQTGASDQRCFKTGDNGIGVWGDKTTGNTPMVALPREDWEHLGDAARGRKVAVTIAGKTVICELRDTMPRKANIKNGGVIDLSPGAAKAFGLTPPFKHWATWRWA